MPTEVMGFLREFGFVGAALLILWAGSLRIWVWGYQLTEAERRAEEWRTLALRSTDTAREAMKSLVGNGRPS